MKTFVLIAILLISFQVFSQDKSEIIQQRIEFISEQLETEELDLTNVIEALNFAYDKPINLNTADKEDLEEIGLLTEIQINDLLLHREVFGKLISIYELQGLKYWDLSTIRLVQPFIKVDDKLDQLHLSFKEAIKQGKFEVFLRYQRIPEKKNAYENVSDSVLNSSNKYYFGNPDRYYTRFRYSYRTNLSLGFTAEKDPGEQFFKGSNKWGFDFYSIHAFYKGGKYLRAVALGDYQIQIGQGLNLWSGYAFGKTADAINIKKSANPIRPYTSVDESRFMRGGAVELGLKDFRLLLFGSHKKVDASVAIDSLDQEVYFAESINQSGLHRTKNEIARKHILKETLAGANFRYEKRNLQLGIAAIYQGYNQPFIKDTLPYNQFDFRGKSTTNLSADFSYVFKNFNFFGEFSYSLHQKSYAQIYGVLFAIDPRVSLSVAFRDYQRGYHSFYNAGFGEGSKVQNERGLYAGISMKFTRAFSVNAYADIFKFPWLRYQVNAPSLGYEVLVQPTYKPNRELEIYARFRQQVRPKNTRDPDGTIKQLEDVTQRNYRINFTYKASESIRLKTRLEYVTINRLSNQPEKGVVLSQDVIYKPKSFPLSFALRYALFDTDSYDSRIYTYENNALYVFSSPAYYYKGSRAYAMIRWKFLRKFDLWVRYGATIYANRKTLGSGAEQIKGNVRSDITIQLRMKF